MFLIRSAIDYVLLIMQYAILARVLLSWIPLPDNQFIRLIYQITEPVLGPIKSIIDKSPLGNNSIFSMIDISPLIAFALIELVRSLLTRILLGF